MSGGGGGGANRGTLIGPQADQSEGSAEEGEEERAGLRRQTRNPFPIRASSFPFLNLVH